MPRTLLTAAVLAAALGLSATAAEALPLVPPAASSLAAPDGGNIVQVYGGCGPYGHRGPYGGCRRGGQAGGYVPGRACPPGWHVGPYGRHCFRNR